MVCALNSELKLKVTVRTSKSPFFGKGGGRGEGEGEGVRYLSNVNWQVITELLN